MLLQNLMNIQDLLIHSVRGRICHVKGSCTNQIEGFVFWNLMTMLLFFFLLILFFTYTMLL